MRGVCVDGTEDKWLPVGLQCSISKLNVFPSDIRETPTSFAGFARLPLSGLSMLFSMVFTVFIYLFNSMSVGSSYKRRDVVYFGSCLFIHEIICLNTQTVILLCSEKYLTVHCFLFELPSAYSWRVWGGSKVQVPVSIALLYSLCIRTIGLRICVHNFLSDLLTACNKSRQKTRLTNLLSKALQDNIHEMIDKNNEDNTNVGTHLL